MTKEMIGVALGTIAEKMNNKTCGECRNFKSIRCGYSEASHPVCCAFKPKMTNGDRILQMSNKELATCIEELAFRFPSWRELLAWLNAQAESEVEDGNNA